MKPFSVRKSIRVFCFILIFLRAFQALRSSATAVKKKQQKKSFAFCFMRGDFSSGCIQVGGVWWMVKPFRISMHNKIIKNGEICIHCGIAEHRCEARRLRVGRDISFEVCSK